MTVMPPSHTNRLDPLPPRLDTIWTSDGGLVASSGSTLTPHIFPIKIGFCEDLTGSYRVDLVGSYREDKEDILFIYGQLVIARDLRGRI